GEAPGGPGRDRLGPCRLDDKAERLWARRTRLPDEAVLVRRAARADSRPPEASGGNKQQRTCPAGRGARARPRAPPGTARGPEDRSLRPRVQALAQPARVRRRGRQPRAPALRGLGLSLRSALERGRRLHPPAAQEARARIADRDRP